MYVLHNICTSSLISYIYIIPHQLKCRINKYYYNIAKICNIIYTQVHIDTYVHKVLSTITILNTVI
jgi:hypothetical protein